MDYQPDLIISGIFDLSFNGEGLLEEVRKTPEGKNIPFILICSGFAEEIISFAKSMDAHCLFSPFHPDHLLNLIQTCLEDNNELDL